MISYYKKHILNLSDRLQNLEPQSDDFDALIETQLYILKCIVKTEENISRRKEELQMLKAILRKSRLGKKAAAETKKRIRHKETRIDEYKWLLYIWRCFGDGIAFKYLDKWSLKSMMYEHKSPEPKQSAGYISGKEGLYKEFALVLEARKRGVPALLTDLTNTIRHGDVCLLGASDPFVLEVKTSKNVNRRVGRQLEAIEKIHDYLENDAADNFRGLPELKRVEMLCKEVHYNRAINETINEAIDVGYCIANPEKGVRYFVQKTSVEVDFDEIAKGIKKPIFYLLNSYKKNKAWGNYYPFTLSIKSKESLYAFLKGDIYLVVILDEMVLGELAKEMGFDFEVILANEIRYSFSKESEGWDEPYRAFVSENMAGRLAFEFVSLRWFMQ